MNRTELKVCQMYWFSISMMECPRQVFIKGRGLFSSFIWGFRGVTQFVISSDEDPIMGGSV